MAQIGSWTVSDVFWNKIEPLVLQTAGQLRENRSGYLALLSLAAAVIGWRQIVTING
jgi:hypothetical protein